MDGVGVEGNGEVGGGVDEGRRRGGVRWVGERAN